MTASTTRLLLCLLSAAISGQPFCSHAQPVAPESLKWTGAPSDAFAGFPFAASLKALDANGNPDTGFNGAVWLTAVARKAAPSLLVSEVAARAARTVELCSVGDAPVAVGGWRLTFYDAVAWPGPRATFIVPQGTVCPPRGVFQVSAGGIAPGFYPSFFLGTDLAWSSNQPDNPIAVLLQDETGRLVDFFCACGGYPLLIRSPAIIPPELWQGLPCPVNTSTSRTYQRQSGLDHENAADWLATNASLGGLNASLRVPFSAPLRAFSVAPGAIQFSQGHWEGSLTLNEPASGVWLHADDGAGVVGDSGTFNVLAGPPLSLELPGGGSEATAGLLGTGRVSVLQGLPTNLTVTLSMNLEGEFLLPATVLLPAGETSVTFTVTNLDDPFLDGARRVTTTASAPGFASASAILTNADDEVGVLTVTIPASAREGNGALVAAGQVIVSLPPGSDYAVTLRSSNTNEVQVPSSVFIPAGQTSVLFNVTIVNDGYLDGPQMASVEASGVGAVNSSAQITVADNENAILFLELYYPVEEGRGVVSNAVRVTLGGLAASNVVVNLVSLNPARLQVPPTMVVPAGQNSEFTYFVVPDDALTNGLEIVQVNASAPGFPDASNTSNVRDNDLQRFFVAPAPVAQVSGLPFSVTVYAHTIDGYVPSTYAGQATLRAVGHAGAVSVFPSNITLAAGGWTGNVTISGESRDTILVVDDGLGHVGSSNPFDVSLIGTSALPVSDLVYDESRGQIVAGVLSGGGSNSNSIVGIDPSTGSIVWSLPLGTEPSRLALSDDYAFLYVGGNITGGVARINLSTRTVALRFPLGADASFGPYFVEDMEVMPGQPRTLVVSRKVAFGAYNQGLAVYDDRVQRPGVVGPGSYAYGYYVGFYGNSNKLYSASVDGMRLVAVRTNGLATIGSRGGALYATDFESAAGFLYGTSGTVFWPETLRVAGAFPASGWVRPDAASGRIAFLTGNRMRMFDQNSYSEVGDLNLTVSAGNPASLIRCGADRLAFRTDENRLVILRTDMIPVPGATDLSVAQTSSVAVPIVGGNLTYTVVVSNVGPTGVATVALVDQLPFGTDFISAVPSQGACAQTNGVVSCQLGALANGATASIVITAQPRTPGEMVNVTRVIGGALNPSNDVGSLTNTAVFGPVLPAVTEIALNAADLSYDSASNRLWVSVAVNNNEGENSLRAISLNAETNPAPIRLGSEPGRMTASASGRFLYVVTAGNSSVRRLDLWNAAQSLQIAVGGVTDFEVLPGTGSSVAICHDGVTTLYDNALPRTQSAGSGRFIELSESGTRIYGVDADYGNTSFVRLNVTPSGASLVDITSGLAVRGPDFRFFAGRLYCTDGIVIDPEALTRVTTLPASGLVVADPNAGEILYLVQKYPDWILTAFNAVSHSPTWAYTLAGIPSTVNSLVGCGAGRFAFRTAGGQVFIINTALLPHLLPADLEMFFIPALSAGPVNSPFTFTGIVRNNGPAPAMNVVITNTFSPGTVLLAQSTAHGTCMNIGGALVCNLGNLAVGGAASFVLTTMKTNPGILLVSATASSDAPDATPTNNTGTFTAEIDAPPSADVMVWDSVTVRAGGQFAYTIIVSNAGPDVAESMALTDVYPTGATVLFTATSQGSVSTNDGNISANLGSIAPGTAATVSLTIFPPPGIALVNRAEISSTTPDPVPANNDSISVATPNGTSLVTKVALLAEDFAYDAAHRRLYASVPQNGGALSNSIVAIDPDSGVYVQQLHFDEPVGKLAVSDDGQYLYAGLTKTGGVLRISTGTGAVEARILLGDERVAIDLAPMPGQPRSIAVSTRWIKLGYDPGIEIYDDTTPRTNTVLVGSGVSYFFVSFPTPADRLYANGYGGFHVLPVDSTGITFPGPVVGGIPATDFVLEEGLAYFDSGHVLNPDTQVLLGTFPFTVGFVAPDISSNRVYFLPQNGSSVFYSTITLRAFNPATYSELWSLAFPTPQGIERGLLKLRSGEFAVRTDGVRPRILVIRTSPLDVPVADVSLSATDSPDPVSVGGVINYSVAVHNDGLWNATNVVVTNTLPAGTSFVSATTSQGTCTHSDGVVACSLGTLANGASATISVAVSPNVTGVSTSRFEVVQRFTDPTLLNNAVTLTTTINPTPFLSIGNTAVLEGSSRTPISFPVTLSAPSTLPVSASYSTLNGTAVAGQDYDMTNGVVTFPPGTTNRTITLTPGIRGNSTISSNRFFFVSLGTPSNAISAHPLATGFIVEDDFNSITVQGSAVVEGNTSRTNAVFSFSLFPASSNVVTVDYETFDGTAAAGSDYLGRRGTLLFAPGTTNQTLRIPVLGDLCNEPDEALFLQLSAPANALLIVNEATGRVLNDDLLPVLSILSLTPAGNGWRIEFSSACGKNYRLLRSDTLVPGSWMAVSDSIAGTGAPMSVTDATASPGRQAFYRVEQIQ